jgi:hypothetical protein
MKCTKEQRNSPTFPQCEHHPENSSSALVAGAAFRSFARVWLVAIAALLLLLVVFAVSIYSLVMAIA